MYKTKILYYKLIHLPKLKKQTRPPEAAALEDRSLQMIYFELIDFFPIKWTLSIREKTY